MKCLLGLLMAAWALAAHGLSSEHWSGSARAGDERTRVELRLEGEAGPQPRAWLSLPDVGVSGWPARSIRRERDLLRIEFPSDSGLQTFVLNRAGDTLQGEWRAPEQVIPARLSLRKKATASVVRERHLRLAGPAGTLGATLLLPAQRTRPVPGVVFVHGSGAQAREASRFAAEQLAAHGVAALIYDKRGVGESTGDWLQASLQDLAADAVALADWLEAQPGVEGVGFIGHSQGAWVGPLAAARRPQSRFLIVVSGPAVGPVREAHWDAVRALRTAGAPPAVQEAARALISQWFEAVRADRADDWAAYEAAYAVARAQPWFAQSKLQGFAERPDTALAGWLRRVADFEPLPLLRRLSVPSLWLLSPDDESIDAEETLALLEQLRALGTPIALKRYPGFDHSLRRLGRNGQTLRWPAQPADLLATQLQFIRAALKRVPGG